MATINKLNSLKSKGKESIEKKLEVQYFQKVSYENRPTLVGRFSLNLEGYPVFGKATLREPEEDKFSINFEQYSFKAKDSEQREYRDALFTKSTETREVITNAIVDAFVALSEDKWAESDKEEVLKQVEEKGIAVRYPTVSNLESRPEDSEKRKAYIDSIIGRATFVTNKDVVIRNCELHKKEDGTYFVGYPAQYSAKEHKSYPLCGPIGDETNPAIIEAAVQAYENLD